MAYTYVPFIPSQDLIEDKNSRDSDYARVSQHYSNGYSQGAGGYASDLNSINQTINNLNNNNTLSQQYEYDNPAVYNKALSDIVNRKEFTYNLADDMLYQQAKEQYQQMGRVAMEDVSGQAASMTGGYGNSYGTAAAAQAYNSYLQQLNNSIGDYYAMALNTYNSETDRLQNAYNALANDRNIKQNEWRSNQDVFNNLMSMYFNERNNLRGLDLQAWRDQGEGLTNVANLSATRYNNDYANASNLWQAGEQLRATQSEQEETERLNNWTMQNGDAELDAKIKSDIKGNELQQQQLGLQKDELKLKKDELAWTKNYQSQLLKQQSSSGKSGSGSSSGSTKKTKKTKKGKVKYYESDTVSNEVDNKTVNKIVSYVKANLNSPAAKVSNKDLNQYKKEIAETMAKRYAQLGKLDKKGQEALYKELGLI